MAVCQSATSWHPLLRLEVQVGANAMLRGIRGKAGGDVGRVWATRGEQLPMVMESPLSTFWMGYSCPPESLTFRGERNTLVSFC